jgi:undecaprenyl-diphosphatase
LGWPYSGLDPELRKAFEVAVHAGAAAALALALRREVVEVLRELDPGRLLRHALELAPAAAAALLWERRIEERLGSARGVAIAQVGAGAALWAADRAPAERPRSDAGVLDSLALGVAQACALVPGVSRNGATLTAARLLRFQRPAANRLSRHAALGVIAGATVLKTTRLARRGLPRDLRAPFAAGAAAAFASTLMASPLVALVDSARGYRAFAAYRIGLGAAALALTSRRSA